MHEQVISLRKMQIRVRAEFFFFLFFLLGFPEFCLLTALLAVYMYMYTKYLFSCFFGICFVHEQVISLRRMQMRVKVFLRRSLLDVYDHEEGEVTGENTG